MDIFRGYQQVIPIILWPSYGPVVVSHPLDLVIVVLYPDSNRNGVIPAVHRPYYYD